MIQDLDDSRLAQLEALLGPQRIIALLGVLQARLERLAHMAHALPDDLSGFRFLVHQSLGSARSLGLSGLAQCLDGLERGLDAAGDAGLPDSGQRARMVEEIEACRVRFETGSRLIAARLKS